MPLRRRSSWDSASLALCGADSSSLREPVAPLRSQCWLLRGVFLGAAAVDDRAAEVFEDIFSACVVTRGNQPMAPGDMLPLRLPEDAVEQGLEQEGADSSDDDEDQDGRPPLDPFERGPEITEIR